MSMFSLICKGCRAGPMMLVVEKMRRTLQVFSADHCLLVTIASYLHAGSAKIDWKGWVSVLQGPDDKILIVLNIREHAEATACGLHVVHVPGGGGGHAECHHSG